MSIIKQFLISVGLISCLTLSSCSVNMPRDTDLQISKKTCDNILTAIENRNGVALKSLFNANTQDEQLNNGIDYLFGYVKGTEFRVENNDVFGSGPQVTEHFESGKSRRYFQDWCRVAVDNESFIVFFTFYSEDDFDKNNVGVSSLRITKESYIIDNYSYTEVFGDGEEAEEKQVTAYRDCFNQMSIGIFVPDGTQTNFLGIVVTE